MTETVFMGKDRQRLRGESELNFSLQLRILDRGMRMLKPGGRLVYSTCSFNPAENEAVVAAALNLHNGESSIHNPTKLAGNFKLVDVSDHLPELKRRPGMTSWKVATYATAEAGSEKTLTWHETFKGYEEKFEAALTEAEKKNKDRKKPLPESLWPPANAEELNLERW